MRVLVITAAVLAYASGAPSGAALAPLAQLAPTLSIAPSYPTISPGDLQAAAINAKVSAEDAVQSAVDQARQFNEEVIAEQKDKIIEANDQAKEKSLEAFWAGQEQTWQTLDAIKTAEASLDGATASNAEAIAKSALISPVVPALPAIIAQPVLTAFVEQKPQAQAQPILKANEQNPDETASFVALNSDKTIVFPGEKSVATQFLSQIHPGQFIDPVGLAPSLKLGEPWLVPSVALIQPNLQALSGTPLIQTQGQSVLAPATIVKAVW